MRLKVLKNTVLLFVIIAISCGNSTNQRDSKSTLKPDVERIGIPNKNIIVGANQTDLYIPLLKNKSVGIVANQTSVIFKESFKKQSNPSSKDHIHLVDSLINHNISVQKVFAPEHGFRGTADAGEVVKDGTDIKTGLPIISLYGSNKKPTHSQLKDIDIIVFDIQDVGARFYTYISTLHYVMESCAENNIPVIVLDRPNPNGHYIDGPILELEHKSFVGMHPIPVVHGLTIGEYAQMINGERWLANGIKCALTVIPVANYTHQTLYGLPIKPSPNLPNDKSINLYPSLCFFEGTNVSVGRGTDKQFQIVGSPFFNKTEANFSFKPEPNLGAKYPKHRDKACYGFDLSNTEKLNELNLKWLLKFYRDYKSTKTSDTYFNDFFTKLAGTEALQNKIEKGLTEEEIKASWQAGLKEYKTKRKNYLLYKD